MTVALMRAFNIRRCLEVLWPAWRCTFVLTLFTSLDPDTLVMLATIAKRRRSAGKFGPSNPARAA